MSTQDFDKAMARRLAKLGVMPIDTSGLERAVRARIDAEGAGAGGTFTLVRRQSVYRSMAAVAASLIFVVLVGMAFLQGRTAQASPDMMMQLHRDLVSGKTMAMEVDTVEKVNKAFAAFGQEGVTVSAPPEMEFMKCCLQDVGNKKVACILLKEGNTAVTLTVADLDAVKTNMGAGVKHNGEDFHVVTAAELTMVTVDRGGHRICLIGELAAEKLMGLSDKLKF